MPNSIVNSQNVQIHHIQSIPNPIEFKSILHFDVYDEYKTNGYSIYKYKKWKTTVGAN